MPAPRSVAELGREARRIHPGVRIGRPARSRAYWPMFVVMRLLRVTFDVDIHGRDRVAPGPAILVGNHVRAMDPVAVGMSTWWRINAISKIENFVGPGGIFFRLVGPIPLRRGDAASTALALELARASLATGSKIGIYPEGTRSPDPRVLHRLHKGVLVPVLRESPDVPVHAVAIAYSKGRGWRTRVTIRISEPLALAPSRMSADELVGLLRDALMDLGGLQYVDRYAGDVKAERRAQMVANPTGSGGSAGSTRGRGPG